MINNRFNVVYHLLCVCKIKIIQMKIMQILIVIGFIIYIVFSSINMMEQYSGEAKNQFRSERNWKIVISIIIFILLYLAGTFNLIIP